MLYHCLYLSVNRIRPHLQKEGDKHYINTIVGFGVDDHEWTLDVARLQCRVGH